MLNAFQGFKLSPKSLGSPAATTQIIAFMFYSWASIHHIEIKNLIYYAFIISIESY